MIALACLGHWIVYRYVPHRDFVKHNDVAGFVLAIVGVVYAVLLSFVVVVVWQQFESSDNIAEREASAAADMYRLSAAYPTPLRQRLRSELRNYVYLMINDEWPSMRLGGMSTAARNLTAALAEQISSYGPRSSEQLQVQAQMLTILRVFLDSRRQRLHDNETGNSTHLMVGVDRVGFHNYRLCVLVRNGKFQDSTHYDRIARGNHRLHVHIDR